MSSSPQSIFQPADRVPSDAVFDLTRRYHADQNPNKINLGQGVYRDENGQPWVLPCVQLAKKSLGDFDHEYQPIAGFKPFIEAATKLVFEDTAAYREERVSQYLLTVLLGLGFHESLCKADFPRLQPAKASPEQAPSSSQALPSGT